jgi:hypothetical protein
LWPKNDTQALKWDPFVRLKQADWSKGTTRTYTVCSAHFTPEAFDVRIRNETPTETRCCAEHECVACNLCFLPIYRYIASVSSDVDKPAKLNVDSPHYIAIGLADCPSASEIAYPSEGLSSIMCVYCGFLPVQKICNVHPRLTTRLK